MKCPICGFQNKSGVKFCERCFSALDIFSVKPEEEGVFCPNGHWNPTGVKFCTICGAPIQKAEVLLSPYVFVDKETGDLISIPLTEDKVTRVVIGRKSNEFTPDVDLSSFRNSATVSRRHARLTINRETGEVIIEDLGSTNGTYINGERLEPQKPYKIQPGDVVSFSKKLHLVFEVKEL
uniref:FHA domain-containing protein n=1 Tax=candidate division WOR-3 bacterium TaxID=2052148 RepID=A0A7V3KMZ3_UNCW3